MKFPPYPEYKPSGVEWLGDVPAHWSVKAIKWESAVLRGASPRPIDDPVYFDDEGEYAWVRISDVTTAGMYLKETTQRLSELGSSLSVRLAPGALFLSIAGSVGKPCITAIRCCIHDGFVYFPRLRGDARFLYYVFASGESYKGLGKFGTQLNLNTDTVGAIKIAFPPVPEQKIVADVLDLEIRKLDTLLRKKHDLIERLKEKRSTLISRTISHGLPSKAARLAGLNPDPALKPSDVEWIADLPTHWITKRLRHISDTITVGVVVNPSNFVSDHGVPFLLGGDIREFSIDTSNCNWCTPEVSEGPLLKSRLSSGDLVVVRVGYPGVAAVVPPELEGANCASMMIVRKHPRFSSRWLAYAFNSQVGRDQIDIVQYGAAQKQFNIGHALDFTFPFPPLEEQKAISAFLDQEVAKISRMIGKVEAVISRLEEYRIALITSAVTGKVDVRGASA
jgi:type I restriction enzyme S subunit